MNTTVTEPAATASSQSRWNLLYPWIIWALSSSFLFYKYVLQVSPSVMIPELMQTYSLTGASLGNLAAFYFYAYLAMQLPVGILLDRWSPKKLVAAAIAVCASGALLFASTNRLGIAEAGRFLIGIGGAFSAVGTMKLITLWFPPRRFALLSGLMMTVGMIGAVGGEAPLAQAVQQYGWRNALWTAAFVGFALALLFWIIVRDTKKNNSSFKNKKLSFIVSIKGIILNKQAWLVALYSGLAFAPISGFAGLWGIPYLMQSYAMPRTMAAGLVSFIFIGFAVGSPISGWFSDQIQRRKPIMFVGTSLALLCLLIILYASNLSSELLGALLFLFGFFTSFFFISFAVMKEINHPLSAGTAIGLINMLNAIGGACAEPLIGKLLDLGWKGIVTHHIRVFPTADYQHALIILPLGLLISLFLLLFARETYCKQQKR